MEEEGQSQSPWHKLPVTIGASVWLWDRPGENRGDRTVEGEDRSSCRGTAVAHESDAADSEAAGGRGREVLVSSAGQWAALLEFFPMPCSQL